MKTYRLHTSFLAIVLLLFISCGKPDTTGSDEYPQIYPDYINITIPCNIAPLNFILRNKPEHIEVVIKGRSGSITCTGRDKIQFPAARWKTFLLSEQGNTVQVQVKAKIDGLWIAYKSFNWTIADKIDPYLTYRLIEPGYEVWNKVQLCERNIENFSVKVFADNNLTGNSCMNCHIAGNRNPNLSFFHIRGEKGGTILNRNGHLRKINTRTKDMFAPATYGDLHPSGRYGIFSTNVVIPGFHSLPQTKLEVYDKASDLLIIDFDTNRMIHSPLVSGNDKLETFPVFSADGNRIYYCVASAMQLPDSIRQLKYSLCSIDFDAKRGEFGNTMDTLINMDSERGQSVSFPRPSPDGRFLLFCLSDYGTFPIWHQETDLFMLDLESKEIIDLAEANSDYSDTYHSWSSNSRWFVFASKRDDGLYGKPYFCYIGKDGKAHKPFVLPQRDPYYYDYTLKSFNIPELMSGKLPFSISGIEELYWKGILEQIE